MPQFEPEQSGFEKRTQALFGESVERLDGRTRSKLTQARHAALQEIEVQRVRPWRKTWVAMAGVGAAAVLAIWVGVGDVGREAADGVALPLDDMDIIAESTEIELLQDVEFYAWIAQRPATADGNQG